MKKRVLCIAIALDIFLLSLITLGGSKRNETISSCLWTLEKDGRFIGKALRPVVDWFFSKLERNHCFTSWLVENKTEIWN